MKNIFNSYGSKRPSSNYFDLTHDVKMSGKIGHLMPCLTMECVPGDKVNLSTDLLVRFAPLVYPIMHRVDVTIHTFFVPKRLLWPGWEEWITNAHAADGTVPPVMPYITLTQGTPGTKTLADYLGIPPAAWDNPTNPLNVSAFAFAAYQMIYNEYYRDQNLDPIPYADTSKRGAILSDGLNVHSNYIMQRRCYEHDYFTSALPFAQKGEEVVIPFQEDPAVRYNSATTTPTILTGSGVDPVVGGGPSSNPVIGVDGLFADISTDGQPSINDLRRSFKLQEWLEKNARGGSRYIEHILSHFGVKSSDARLNRPEYITGLKAPVIISEVLNTTGLNAPDQLPQGSMAGHGVSASQGRTGSYYCEEHGIIMSIASVVPKSAYMQGIPRMFIKNDPLDYYWPSFAHLGEQPIQNQEIYAEADQTDPYGTFGYTPRYAEYKYFPSRVQGEFRTTLNRWHMTREFAASPPLNADFVQIDPEDVNRVFAVELPSEDTVFMHILHKMGARRPMPVFGTPTI